ncbi:hypothetical protein PR001_g30161 [Phytophthora rubi]|uniref:Uncharacterized protein n=1 Tax=Phytophthora rubi TaxID=129364 RepID=A0A6A3GVI7_9STRA|nr:hypothetical protein PR001_g30161 [Phytophthora rubi]
MEQGGGYSSAPMTGVGSGVMGGWRRRVGIGSTVLRRTNAILATTGRTKTNWVWNGRRRAKIARPKGRAASLGMDGMDGVSRASQRLWLRTTQLWKSGDGN